MPNEQLISYVLTIDQYLHIENSGTNVYVVIPCCNIWKQQVPFNIVQIEANFCIISIRNSYKIRFRISLKTLLSEITEFACGIIHSRTNGHDLMWARHGTGRLAIQLLTCTASVNIRPL